MSDVKDKGAPQKRLGGEHCKTRAHGAHVKSALPVRGRPAPARTMTFRLVRHD